MTNLLDDYSKLLNYLDKQKKASEGYALHRRNPSEVKKEQVTNTTNKFLEDSQIHSHVPGNVKHEEKVKKSKGFSVKKFEDMMRSKLVDDFKKIQTYERPYISVGELYICMRQTYYARSRYAIDLEKKFKFAWLYFFQRVGDELHNIIQDVYNFTEVEKTIVSEKYKTKGRIDGIRDDFLYEIKSVDPDKFKYECDRQHYLQANIYAHILNTEYNYKIHTIVILYVFRNLRKIVPFDLPVDASLAESYLKHASMLKNSIDNKIVPDPVCSTIDQCQWCLYKKYCEKDKCKLVVQPYNRKKKEDISETKQKKNKIETPTEKSKKQYKRKEAPKRKGAFLL